MKSINVFWNWFRDNQNEIFNLMESTADIQNHHLAWLDTHLNNHCEHLDLILVFPKNIKTKAHALVSVNGKEEYLPQAAALNAKAPKLGKWKFITLLPKSTNIAFANNTIFNKILHDINLKNQNLPKPNGDLSRVHLIIHFKNCSIICNHKTVAEAVRYVFQNLMKWKELSKINFVQVASSSTIKNNIVELYDLDFYLDELNKSASGDKK